MATKQIIAYGATVGRSHVTGVFVNIPECKAVAIPMVETEFQDVTNLDSEDGFREYIKGLKDGGVISVACGYTSLGYAQQLEDEARPLPIRYRTTMRVAPGQSSGDVFEFSGFPTPQVEGSDLGSPVAMTISIRTTGGITWTAGAAA